MQVLNLTLNNQLFSSFWFYNPDNPYVIFGLNKNKNTQNLINHLTLKTYVVFNNKEKKFIESFSYIWVKLIGFDEQKNHIEFIYQVLKKGEIND